MKSIYKFVETMPKQNISPTRFFPHKERYEIFDGKIFAVEKNQIFVQDFVPIRTALNRRTLAGNVRLGQLFFCPP